MTSIHYPPGTRVATACATAIVACSLLGYLARISHYAGVLPRSAVASETTPEDAEMMRAAQRIEQFRKGDIHLQLIAPTGVPVRAGQLVHVTQTRHSFLFGANLFRFGKLDPGLEEQYEQRFAELFNYATLPFYWKSYEPEPGQTRRDEIMQMLAWCERNGITPKGHPLAWNNTEPEWLSGNQEEIKEKLLARVRGVVSEYRGKIAIWDTVNEATEYDREKERQDAPLLTNLISTMGVGPYLRSVFMTAHAANPDATLIINDYIAGSRYEEQVLSKLQESGQPLYDAIGVQCHQHTGVWPPERLRKVAERLGSHGRPVHFTETSILSGELQPKGEPHTGPWPSTPEGELRQKDEVVRYYTVLFSLPQVKAITWWDLTDKNAWKNAPAGLLRKDMTPKPAYEALRHLLKEKWQTRLTASVGESGGLALRGFYGDYLVTVDDGGQQWSGTFALRPGTPALAVVKLQ